jgi:DNA-binding FadR family transcriptional regulator
LIKNSIKKIGAADISAKIKKEILSGSLNFQDKLPPERSMAEFYKVSRGTIRSALNFLEIEDYIIIKPGSGAFVSFNSSKAIISEVENANPLELIDARFAIEPHICRLAILYGKREHFDKLDALMTMMEKNTNDVKEFAVADTSFHKTLAESTGNNLLIWIISQITAARGLPEWTKARNLTLNKKIIVLFNSQHRNILSAIIAREPELAASAMKEHLETARLSLTRASGT